MPEKTLTPEAPGPESVVLAAPETVQNKPRSLGQDAWRELRSSPLFWISSGLLVLFIFMAAFPSVFTDVDPRHADLRNHFLGKPNWTHFFQEDWFGYNIQGQSVYARTVYGARASIIVGICVTLAVTILGGLVGMLAGYFGGWVDALLSRVTDIFFGIPLLLGGLVTLQAFTHRTVWTVVFGLTLFGWMQIARVMRGAVITQKQADFVTAARALGAGTGRILFRHILPNAIGPVIVVSTIALGGYISTEATLSYLGIGLQDPVISWGVDISDAQKNLRDAPHNLLVPATFLSLTVLAFILLGDAVRDALDPKLR
ncbi:peptide ABC transporter permease [Streptomyces cinnamoneus]|uniref:Peptide ABC transporter permease n=1 Tax=Streptomyces cinnamoneus TaxID=53446 RepID=A0A2G1XDV6_STRCJ|nr:ABC transporter permease [Streptomyces cinnamoneus]PHQ49420.1 peptide ABC transporter permease [Streptomyces cinnamoneus]PPT14930.1 ABC transporter permease [Streptomyces cinnamoneus]